MPKGLNRGPGAIVLQEQQSPLDFLIRGQQFKQQQAALQAQQEKEAYEKRWKYYKEQQAIGNDPVGNDWLKEFNQYWKVYNNDLNQWMQSGRDINVMDDQRFNAQRKFMQDWAKSANALDKWGKEDQERAEKDMFIDDDMSQRVNYELTHHRDGSTISPLAQPVSEMYSRKYSPENLHRGLFKFDTYVNDFFGNTEENIYKTYEEKMSKNGNPVVDMVEYKAKVARPIYADPMNPASNEIIGWDRTVDKHTYNEFVSKNPLAESWMEEELRTRGAEVSEANKMELLQEYADDYSELTKNITSTKGRTGAEGAGLGFDTPQFTNRMNVLQEIFAGNPEALSRAKVRGAELTFNYERDPKQVGPGYPPLRGAGLPESVTVEYFKEVKDPLTGISYGREPIKDTIDFSNRNQALLELNNIINTISPSKQNVNPDVLYDFLTGQRQGQPLDEL